jgi:hypothetical protein
MLAAVEAVGIEEHASHRVSTFLLGFSRTDGLGLSVAPPLKKGKLHGP